MKTLLSLFLVFCVGAVQAQKVIKLDPATVTYTSPKVLISSNMDNLKFEVKEDFSNHFMSNPIKFVETNFDVKSLGLENYEGVTVSFITKKGHLNASFDKNGELVRTTQRFEQIPIPMAVWNEIYKENVGWTMVSNLYTASGKGNKINKELYKVKLANGNEIKRIKFVPKPVTAGKIASN